MQSLIEQLIADFHERALPLFTRRHIRLPWLPGKIDTLIGMRRSGKTWFLFQTISDILAGGTPKETILYLNMEDERLLPLRTDDLHHIPDVYFRMYPHQREHLSVWCFDEIQNVPGWERFIRRVLDTEHIHICLTGSSAKLLSREIATSLRGRSLSTEIFPFSFAEALEHQGIEATCEPRPGARQRSLFEHQLKQYLLEGGFPEVQGIAPEYRIAILQEYLNVVILRDLVERHQISNTVALRYLLRHVLQNIAGLFSVNKFYHDLKSQGIACGKTILHDYLGYIADAYLLFPVCVYTRSERARMVNPRKVYAIDTGLAQACSRKSHPDWGHLLENFVFLELRRRYATIEYYKTRSGSEVDFLITDIHGQQALIQVAFDVNEQATKQRELQAMAAAMTESGLSAGTIVTFNQEDHISTKAGTIHIVPAWFWALTL